MSDYGAVYEERFLDNLRRYASRRFRIKQRVDHALANPYLNTEFLTDPLGKLDLLGCRSARVDRDFRVIFVVCEEQAQQVYVSGRMTAVPSRDLVILA
jgi:hypothetical protein